MNTLNARQNAAVAQLQALRAMRENARSMRRAAVVEAWLSGIRSMTAIAQILDVSRDTVTRDLSDAGVRPIQLLAPAAK